MLELTKTGLQIINNLIQYTVNRYETAKEIHHMKKMDKLHAKMHAKINKIRRRTNVRIST